MTRNFQGNLRRTLTAAAISLVFAAMLALVGCSGGLAESESPDAAPDTTQESTTRVVVDMQGNEVEVPSDITNAFNG